MPARDLSYFLASSVVPTLRRREIERDLVERYHLALTNHGVRDYTCDACWQHYRIGMTQAPLISVIGCAFAAQTERGHSTFVHTLRRSLLAIRDHDTVEILAT
ncbi:hypothetical protein HZU40_17500 [Mycolicibacterium fluoranthenivorans]|uniref:Uncharacterized protein n=1 Tax=Mycolicibacterium fluoranthenivorans TaxID=258505 RepID=A0A7G8P6X8_9MYCO|nr:hypothetical protein [Mycolicibacterium fluoranthenivorans]QNJ90094.1 hypothetical protein HZU40_17500 [Mycolicibacterium fluoranthenivorans]